ncbi:MAG: hypothetical protein LBC20_03625 [Planctomycetaceae bacterium]|nr:hypothetical protein [Planctomycetaceae bacterium]
MKLDEFWDRKIPRGGTVVSWSLVSLILVICRFCNPSSELSIAEHYYKSTALSDLFGVLFDIIVMEKDVTRRAEISWTKKESWQDWATWHL